MGKKKDNKEKNLILKSKDGMTYAIIVRDPKKTYVEIYKEDGTFHDFMIEDFFNSKFLPLYETPEIKEERNSLSLSDKKTSKKKLYASLKEFFNSISQKELFNSIIAEPGYQKIMDFMDQMEKK